MSAKFLGFPVRLWFITCEVIKKKRKKICQNETNKYAGERQKLPELMRHWPILTRQSTEL